MARIHSKNIVEILGQLEPIACLSADSIGKLACICKPEELNAGDILFNSGEEDNKSIYLITGTVNVSDAVFAKDSKEPVEGVEVRTLTSESVEAKYPIDDKQPHQASAKAVTPVEIIRIDTDVLDKIITQDQLSACKTSICITEEAGKENFFTKLFRRFTGSVERSTETVDPVAMMNKFQPPLFEAIPPEELKELFSRMESIPVKSGTVVIRQDEDGDYYYLIVSGTAVVTRQVESSSEPVFLAELVDGQTFGEEALVSNAKRNATVTMKTKGTLLRLAKRDFVERLKEPLLEWLSPIEAQNKVREGAKWLDVRPVADFQRSRLSGAISMPLHELRERMPELDKDAKYICCCDTGRLSSSAAFLLGQKGYKIAIMRGGLQRLAEGSK